MPAANESPGFLGGLGNTLSSILNSQAATAYAYGYATSSVAGRQPNTEQFADPTTQPRGGANQPGTDPVITPTAWQQAAPFVIAGGVVLALAAVWRLFFRR